MTIKDIAGLAGVSVSTVSKIMNNKDSHINAKTRERVLAIIKEYDYKPYAGMKSDTNSFLIGVIFPEDAGDFSQENAQMFEGFLDAAGSRGYSILPMRSGPNPEDERKCLSQLISKGVCAILWYPRAGSDAPSAGQEEMLREIRNKSIPHVVLNSAFPASAISPAYARMGYLAGKKLIDLHHRKILCITHDASFRSLQTLKGFEEALSEEPGISCTVENIQDVAAAPQNFHDSYSAVFCGCETDALRIFDILERNSFSIPADISLTSLLDFMPGDLPYPKISGVRMDSRLFGKALTEALIDAYEAGTMKIKTEPLPPVFEEGATLDVPPAFRAKSILSIGTINFDTTIMSGRLPESGTSLLAYSSTSSIGGKGVNQAVGAARLGQKVVLIGKIGNDAAAIQIMEELHSFGVLTHAVSRESRSETGKAYIQLEPTGESTITVVPGANNYLSGEYVRSKEAEFINAGYCMITGETPLETVIEACTLCRKHGVLTIYKPAAIHALPDSVYHMIDYFIPNQYEASLLSGICNSPEEQADFFLQKGCGNVIITLGSAGCYLKNKDGSFSDLPCTMFSVIDNTGAADAFISTFTSLLSMQYDLKEAVHIAQISAAYVVSKIGSASSMIDLATLESYVAIDKNKSGG